MTSATGPINPHESLPEPSSWPHRPLLLRASDKTIPSEALQNKDALPLGAPVEFESDLFKGKILTRIKNAPSDNQELQDKYFDGRKRTFQMVIQGSFKEKIAMSTVHYGDLYARPFKLNRVARIAVSGMGKVLSPFAPGIQFDIAGEKPKVLVLLAGNAQALCVNKPGDEPDITSINLEEDTALLGTNYDSVAHRRKKLSNPKHAAKRFFDPNLVYTFEFYDHMLDFVERTFTPPVGKTSVPMGSFLNGNPFSFCAMTVDDRVVMKFILHHEEQKNDPMLEK
eukprot:CAMPEP_0185732336 /NCGR_PEP_ID=MMETSP1171-20130828/15828_1 /TAXON_ID=374046 /ORGANISM="Helicotheca tamensis, Strain CCMP826" /LENGTH=281 /DNA_ID=CAMNT_0028401793 /DNA_START=96 /DNA_END=941 /DNA_ORIENTATION=+